MSTIANFEIPQGSTFSRNMTIVDNDKVVLNLTTYTINGQVRKSYNSAEYISFDIVKVNAPTGKISIGLTDSVTDNLTSNKYVYDIEITSVNGTKTRILEGIITTSPNVTR